MTTTTKTATNNFKVDTATDNTATGTEVAENKKARKPYSINPVIDEDSPVKFNHVDICIENDVLKISGLFECKNIETAYRRFRKIMAQVATEVPKLEGWDEWEPAKKLTFDETEKIWLNENGEMIFDTKYTTNILNVDINEDTIYIWGTFYTTAEAYRAAHPEEPNCNIELEVDNTVEAEYKPQTAWENPHDFTTVGNLNGQPRKYVEPETGGSEEDDAAEDNVEVESVNDEKPKHTTDDELNQPPTAEELYKMFAKTIVNANAMNVTLQNGRKILETHFEGAYVTPEYYFKHWFIKDNLGFLFARYDTPEQVETVINMLKAAIDRGEEKFTFPTVKGLILRGSLKRAAEIARKKYHEYEREGDNDGMLREIELFSICTDAIKELEAA